MNFCTHCGTRLVEGSCPSCADGVEFDAVVTERELRQSPLATLGTMVAIVALAALGVLLWNLVADGPQSLSTATTFSLPSLVDESSSSLLPAPLLDTAPDTLPSTTLPSISPTLPGSPRPVVIGTVVTPIPGPQPAGTPLATSPTPSPSVLPPVPQSNDSPGGEPAENDSDSDAQEPPAPNTTTTETVLVATGLPPVPPADSVEETTPTTVPPTLPPTSPPTTQLQIPRGVPQVIQDPMPSGLKYWEAQAGHLLAQQVADFLAFDSDVIDVASTVMFDARRLDDLQFDLLMVIVSNEAGSRTNLYCEVWRVDVGTGSVSSRRRMGTIRELTGTVSSAAAVADHSLNVAMRTSCPWP